MCLSPAVAADFSLTKVTDFNTAIPNGTGNFTNFFNSPLVSGDYVAFKGSGRFGQQGLYLFDGRALRRVADRSTPIPDGTGNFTEFYWLALSGTNVLFDASGSSGQRGLYLFDGGTLLRVADTNTPIPEGTGTFSFTEGNAISGRRVAFFGGQLPSGHHGIYLFDGSTLRRIVDTTTPIPNGTGNFSNMGSPLISADHVAFVAGGGIYLFDGHTLRRVADQSTPIPNGTGNFTNGFYLPMISGNNLLVSYTAPCVLPECDPDADRGHEWPPFRGTYLFTGSTLSRVADNLNTPIPNGTGNFSRVDEEVIDGSHVAFSGSGSSGQVGIYVRRQHTDGDRGYEHTCAEQDGALQLGGQTGDQWE